MAFRYLIILFAVFLTACAQVKSLQGGPVDENPPVPYSIVPANGSVNFTGQAIAITFDEYVKLNNPTQTISMIPNDAKIIAELRDKTLMLYWEEKLRDNTTYSIFLNRSVKDISEGNDSIMQVVFSTGPYIDSLSYTTYVVDAKEGTPQKNMVVGLFAHPDSLKPIYFGLTDDKGMATLNYLRAGNYYLRAFEDKQKRGGIGVVDAMAFKEEQVQIDSSVVDSLPMRIFPATEKADITTFKFSAPSTFTIGATRPLDNVLLKFNDTLIAKEQIKWIENDSIVVTHRPGNSNLIVLTANASDWDDTTRVRIQPTRSKITRLNAPEKDFGKGMPIILSAPDRIDEVDTSKLKIFNYADSTYITDYTFEVVNQTDLHIHLPATVGEKVKLTTKNGVVKITQDWIVSDFEQTFQQRYDKDFGTLNVTVKDYYEGNLILELLSKGKVIKRRLLDGPQVVVFEKLTPDEYTFKIILDKDGNGEWTSGNFTTKVQPEEIHVFSTPTKVRANWDISVELVPLVNK